LILESANKIYNDLVKALQTLLLLQPPLFVRSFKHREKERYEYLLWMWRNTLLLILLPAADIF